MKRRPKRIGVIGGLVAGSLTLLGFLYWVAVPSTMQWWALRPARNMLRHEYALLEVPLWNLGVQGDAAMNSQCSSEGETRLSAVTCSYSANYQVADTPLSGTALAGYLMHAAQLDTKLKADGWVPDRPHDQITRLAELNPESGGTIPYHKNVGAVSCNLDVGFVSQEPISYGAGVLIVNQFSCRETIHSSLLRYFTPETAAD